MLCICSNDELKVKDYTVDVLFILIKIFIGHNYLFRYFRKNFERKDILYYLLTIPVSVVDINRCQSIL